jgi:2'-5' RNA ligase
LRRAIRSLAVTLPMPRGARLTRPERYHLTVAFLGDFDPLPEPLLAAIRSAAGSVRAQCFELSLDHFDNFPGSRVGWLGPRSVPGALTALHDALDVALRSARVPLKSSTPFVPHITVQRNVRTTAPAMDVPPLLWTVRDFVLVQSMPGSPDPYRIVGTWPLVTR